MHNILQVLLEGHCKITETCLQNLNKQKDHYK